METSTTSVSGRRLKVKFRKRPIIVEADTGFLKIEFDVEKSLMVKVRVE